MSVADWKPVHQAPQDYGTHLVKVKGRKESTVAIFDHPIGFRHTGWYELTDEGIHEVEVTHWDTLPL